MAISTERVENDMFDTMWAFLQMGGQKANYPLLKEYCLDLRQLMTQKNNWTSQVQKRQSPV